MGSARSVVRTHTEPAPASVEKRTQGSQHLAPRVISTCLGAHSAFRAVRLLETEIGKACPAAAPSFIWWPQKAERWNTSSCFVKTLFQLKTKVASRRQWWEQQATRSLHYALEQKPLMSLIHSPSGHLSCLHLPLREAESRSPPLWMSIHLPAAPSNPTPQITFQMMECSRMLSANQTRLCKCERWLWLASRALRAHPRVGRFSVFQADFAFLHGSPASDRRQND